MTRLFRNPLLAGLALPLGLYTGLMLATAPLEITLTAQKRVKSAGIVYILSDATRALLLVGAVVAGGRLAGLAWAAAVHGLLRLLALLALIARGLLRLERPRRATLRPHLGYALSFAAAGFVIIATSCFPQYAVSTCTNAATYALFAVGTMQLPIADLLYTPVSEVMMVRLASEGPAAGVAIYHEATARLATFFFGLAAASWSLAPVLIPALFTNRFADAVPLWMISVAEMPIVALPLDGVLRSLAATNTILVSNVVRLAFMVPLTLLGLHWHGLAGAVAGFVVAQYAGRAFLLWQVARLLRLGLRRLLPWRALLATAGRSAIAALPALLVRYAVNGTPKVLFLLGAAAFGFTYLALLYLAGDIHEALGLERIRRRGAAQPAASSVEAH